MKQDDMLWKGILESTIGDFLCFFFPDADSVFDLSRGFRFLDKELSRLFPHSDSAASKFVDKLVKVYTRNGQEEWLLLHIEVQGYKDPLFEERMFTYFYRIRDKYHKFVSAIAVLTDRHDDFRPSVYRYECLGTELTYRFNAYKIADQDELSLLNNPNPFAIVILTALLSIRQHKMDDLELMVRKMDLVRNLLRRNLPPARSGA